MKNQLQQSMMPTASFYVENLSEDTRRLCLIPGHYNTEEVVKSGEDAYLVFSDPTPIKDAGFECDQVADDNLFPEEAVYGKGKEKYNVSIKPVTKRTRYRDFLNYIKLANLRVVKIRIITLNSDSAIFNQEMEISASAIGQKAGSDFVQLSAHRVASNYDQSFIEIDLAAKNLILDETTLAALDIPALAKIQIDFTLSN